MLVNGKKELDFSRKYHCCYASRKTGLPYRDFHEDILSRYGDQIVQVVQVPGVFASALGDIGYIYRSPDLDEIEAIARSIHAHVDGEG